MKRVLFLSVLIMCTVSMMCFSNVKNAPSYFDAVIKMGYADVEHEPCEIEYITIPEEFGAVYVRYNEMLKKEGYDLSFYKGERCIRYTYFIPSVNARANILVHNGEIIGGDICGITIDSIMIPIKK